MPTYRVPKTKNFAIIQNALFEDPRISWEAKGVMGYILTKPDNWIVRVYDLVRNGPAGTHKIGRILRELEKVGYPERVRTSRADGTFEWVISVYEDPQMRADQRRDMPSQRAVPPGQSHPP